jgi:ADP-ribose pyrophosphatase YjhB (NUDIX family)
MHTLGAFAIILDADSRVLLCHRTDRDAWNLPGGRVEAGESPWDAVTREVEEETGILMRVDRLLGIYSVPAKNELVLNFLGSAIAGKVRLNAEADAIQWFPRGGIPPNTLPRHIERIADAYANLPGVCLKVQ